MARADLLTNLVKSGRQNDQESFRRIVESMAAEERAKQHHVLADRLLEQLRAERPRNSMIPRPDLNPERFYSVELSPRRRLSDLILDDDVSIRILELIEEQNRADLLRSHNVEPRHRVLLAGPPGNGKTSLAEAVAEALMVPLLVVKYDTLIGSFLGETAGRLAKLFDFARSQKCVLFLDEFDVLAKERGDVHETGEIKRLVSSLLLQIDNVPAYCVVMTATNHPELLDRAVWRRFQLRLQVSPPNTAQTLLWLEKFEHRVNLRMDISKKTIASKLKGASYSELEDFGLNVYRRYVLSLPDADVRSIVQTCIKQHESLLRPQEQNGMSSDAE